MPDKNSVDLLGIQPLAKSAEIVTAGVVQGLGAFLGRICLPAAEEFGLLLRDRVSDWRGVNLINTLARAEQILSLENRGEEAHAHPRILGKILDEASWTDESDIQEKWAGLIASSCTMDGKNQDNLHFVDLLSKLTPAQVRILSWACEHCPKRLSSYGLVVTDSLLAPLEDFHSRSGQPNLHILDREVDHLRGLELLTQISGLNPDQPIGIIQPTSIALQMYVRCRGSLVPPDKFSVWHFHSRQARTQLLSPNERRKGDRRQRTIQELEVG